MTQAPLSSASKWESKGVASPVKGSNKGTHSRAWEALENLSQGEESPSLVSPGTGASSITPTLHALVTQYLLFS